MEHQDWKPVVWTKPKKTVHVQHTTGNSLFKKIDGDEPPPPEKITQDVKIRIQQARTAKKLTQKQLAQQINVPAATIASYESGKAIPNKATLRKIGNALGIKL